MDFYEPRFQIEVIRPLEGDVRVEVYSGQSGDTGRALWAQRESPREVVNTLDENELISESYFDLDEDIEKLVLELNNDEISRYEEKLKELLPGEDSKEVENPLYRIEFYHLDDLESKNVSEFSVGYDNLNDYIEAVEVFSEIQSLAHSNGRVVTPLDDEV